MKALIKLLSQVFELRINPCNEISNTKKIKNEYIRIFRRMQKILLNSQYQSIPYNDNLPAGTDV